MLRGPPLRTLNSKKCPRGWVSAVGVVTDMVDVGAVVVSGDAVAVFVL